MKESLVLRIIMKTSLVKDSKLL